MEASTVPATGPSLCTTWRGILESVTTDDDTATCRAELVTMSRDCPSYVGMIRRVEK